MSLALFSCQTAPPKDVVQLVFKKEFSKQGSEDFFILSYNQNDIRDTMEFQILNASKHLLYKNMFAGTQLLDCNSPSYLYFSMSLIPRYLEGESVVDSLYNADETYIRSRIFNFFNVDKFQPNPLDSLLNIGRLAPAAFNLPQDDVLTGFYFKLFVEKGYEVLGYSRKFNKVRVIGRCC